MKDILSKSKHHPRHRLQYIYDLAKSKTVCEGGDSVDSKFDPTVEPEEPKMASLDNNIELHHDYVQQCPFVVGKVKRVNHV